MNAKEATALIHSALGPLGWVAATDQLTNGNGNPMVLVLTEDREAFEVTITKVPATKHFAEFINEE